MFKNSKKIKNLEETVNSLVEDLNPKMSDLYESIEKIQNRLDAIDSIMEDFKKYEENKRLMKQSDEPWADFTVELTDEAGRVKVKFDWNKAMIQELRRQGFNASKEEDIISMFFARLISEHGDVMSHEELEEIRNA